MCIHAQHWPPDKNESSKDELYIQGNDHTDFEDLWQKAQKKWPGIKMEELEIAPEYVHTHHLNYDRYDPSDYTNFLRLTAKPSYFQRMGERQTLPCEFVPREAA